MRSRNIEKDILARIKKTLNFNKKNKNAFLHEPNFDKKEIKHSYRQLVNL